MTRYVDITEQRFGKCVAKVRLEKNKWGNYEWECLCDCGCVFKTSAGRLRSGMTKSCGCLSGQKHGLSKTRAYKCFRHAKERCYDQRHRDYHRYGGAGVTISDEFLNDVVAWCEYLGEPPDEVACWTVDRIDWTKGYERGNMRWLELSKQPRNQRKRNTNTSGVTGVVFYKKNRSWVAEWLCEGRHRSKSFNVEKYGHDEAFRLACEYRAKMIAELNEQGAGYTTAHGT